MHTKESLLRDLKKLGVPQDRPVLVHTSLKGIGPVQGGAEAVLTALREHITARGGILMIPTHTWDNYIEGREFSLDLNHLNPCIGVLPQVASASPDAIISENPTHSIAFFGDEKRILSYMEEEERVDTPTAPHGCYGKLIPWEGSVLLLGVDQTKNTFLHAVEEILVGKKRYFSEPVSLKIRRKDGSTSTRDFYVFDESEIGDVSERFGKFEAPFSSCGAIRYGTFGSAEAQLCDTVKMAEVMGQIYEKACGRELLADHAPIPREWY